MEIQLEEIKELSGPECVIYSVKLSDEETSLFQEFLNEYYPSHKDQIDKILTKLETIGEVGAIEIYFRLKEGKPGDGVCALDEGEEKRLRLYCIRYSKVIIILGGGGEKDASTWQQSPILKPRVELIMEISKEITKLTQEKSEEISWNKKLDRFVGKNVK